MSVGTPLFIYKQHSFHHMKNSNEYVFLRRIPNRRLPFEVYQDSSQSIGSFIDSETRQTFRCLNYEEERKLLPQFLNMSSSDPMFTENMMEFYANLNIIIPPATDEKEMWGSGGLKLNITVGEDGNPLAPMDYIYYKHSLGKKDVARSLNEAKENPRTYNFFIIDLASEQREKTEKLESFKKSMTQYINLTSGKSVDYEHITTLLSVLKPYGSPDLRISELSDPDKLDELRKIAEKNPVEFYSAATNKNIAELNVVLAAVESDIINKINGVLYYGEIKLGGQVLDAVNALTKPTMSTELLEIKAKIEALK